MRLLVPAATVWAVVAALLATTPQVATLAAASFAAAGTLLAGWRWRHRIGHRCPPWTGVLSLTACAVSLALGCLAAHIAIREAGPVRELAQERATVTITATVASDPRLLPPSKGRPEADAVVVVRLDVTSVAGRGSSSSVQSPVLLFGDRSWLSARWQQEVEAVGRLGPTSEPADDVVALLTARGPPRGRSDAGALAALAERVRSRFAAATEALPSDARGLLPGLVIGDTSRTPTELTDAMLVTGMTHLSAVSGSNVAIVLAAALGASRLAGLRRRWRPVAAAMMLAAFVVLVRPEPSVLRAATMGAVGLLGLSTSRRRAGIPALAAAVLVLLCWDPWLARSAGFALSSLATLGLLLFVRSWGAVIGRWLPARVSGWGPALAIPCAAQLMCAPVIVVLQGSVSLIGVLANLLAAPLVAPATVLGVATALLSLVSETAAGWVGWAAALPTLGIAWVARTGAEAPFATVPWPGGGWGAVVLAVASLGAVLGGPWVMHHARGRPLVAVAAILVTAVVAVPTQIVTWPPRRWQFVACDVGQGDGLVLASGPGRAVVVDVGPDPRLMDACLTRLHVSVVDAIVLTHFHADHVDGLPGVLRGRLVRQILATPVGDPQYQWQEVHDWAAAAGVPLGQVYAGDDLAWPGVTAHVWWPAQVIHAGSVPNNASVVMTVDVSGLRLLMLGDVEREAAHQVLLEMQKDTARGPPTFDVVKVAHHGSSNRDDGLLALVRAPVAVISVGAGNDYGHPAASTIATLTGDGYRVFRTDLEGDVAVDKGEGSTVEVTTSR